MMRTVSNQLLWNLLLKRASRNAETIMANTCLAGSQLLGPAAFNFHSLHTALSPITSRSLNYGVSTFRANGSSILPATGAISTAAADCIHGYKDSAANATASAKSAKAGLNLAGMYAAAA
ncbi:hypothetical protein CEUSTIGMA_g11032.t1, partial [Chlamydomonas eustigma]